MRCQWSSLDIKRLILDKNNVCKSYICSDKSLQFFNQFKFLQTKLSSLIEEFKNQYDTLLSHKLLYPKTSQKLCWSILKTFLNNEKIPCIPPLLHQDKFVTYFKEEANVFFADQCSIVRNNSELLSTHTNPPPPPPMISIRMIKICDTSICRPLRLIFQPCLESGKFPI